MYTLSCLQVAYEFLNREWIYLIYGDQRKTCYKTLKNRITHLYCYIMDLINPKNPSDWCSKDNYKFLIIIIVTSLGVLFTTYKVMKILHSPEVKNIMESQCRGNENSNKMSPAFHENNNENAQITGYFLGETSLTAIVKPTIRTRKMRKSLDSKFDHGNFDKENSSDSDVNESSNDIINVMNFAENLDFVKPLAKCTSSLRVVTSKDSLNEEISNKCENENSNPEDKKNEGIKISNEINNNNDTFAVKDTSSVCDVNDCVSVTQNSINPYHCSMLTSPDTLSLPKNSSYASGHFVENFPDLDLSPILNVSPKNNKNQQSTIELTDKEIAPSKNEKDQSHRKNLDDKNDVSNSTHSVKCLEKSSDFYFSCWDFKSFLSGKMTSNERKSKIPKPNSSAEEEGLNALKLNTPDASGSKIPIPSRKSPTVNVSAKFESNIFKKPESRVEKPKDKIRLRESELSLERFVQLEVATGCCSASHLINLQSSKRPEKILKE